MTTTKQEPGVLGEAAAPLGVTRWVDASGQALNAGSAAGDAESEARKRKLGEADEADLKRSRRKTGKFTMSPPPI